MHQDYAKRFGLAWTVTGLLVDNLRLIESALLDGEDRSLLRVEPIPRTRRPTLISREAFCRMAAFWDRWVRMRWGCRHRRSSNCDKLPQEADRSRFAAGGDQRAPAREKSIRHGHPSTLHLWWARRPLAACRAVLFASLVDDPDSDPQSRKPTARRRRSCRGSGRQNCST